jgi:hypothetical protein
MNCRPYPRRKLEGITMSNIKEAYRDLEHDERALTRAMELLQQAQWVGEAISQKKGSTLWPVNPLVHERFAERAASERIRRDAEREKIARARKIMDQVAWK